MPESILTMEAWIIFLWYSKLMDQIDSNDISQCLVEEGSFSNVMLMIIPENHSWILADAVVLPDAQSTASTFNDSAVSIEPLITSPSENVHAYSELHDFKIPL